MVQREHLARVGLEGRRAPDHRRERYLDEGGVEGVAGDVAFVQAIVETGWFRFADSSVPPSYNNFAGIGATDVNPTPAQFLDRCSMASGRRSSISGPTPTATLTTCTQPPLHRYLRRSPLRPRDAQGQGAQLEPVGNGNWATDPTYAGKIWNLYESMLSYNHVPVA